MNKEVKILQNILGQKQTKGKYYKWNKIQIGWVCSYCIEHCGCCINYYEYNICPNG